MQTVTWSRIEDWLLSLTGNDSFSTDEKAWIKSAVNRRIRMAYEESPFWPRYINEELRWAGFDNVVPVDEEGKDSIDTLLATWDSDPRKRISTAQRYESVARSDGFQLLGLADGDYQDVSQTVDESFSDLTVLSQQTESAFAISFWMKGDKDDWTYPDGTVETTRLQFFPLNLDGIAGSGQIYIDIQNGGESFFYARQLWGAGFTSKWFVDGIEIGPISGTDDINIDSYLDGEWHHVIASANASTTIGGQVQKIAWGQMFSTPTTLDWQLEFADVRIYANKIDPSSAAALYANPEAIGDGNELIYATDLPKYWCSYKSQLTNYYGDGAGETSTVPVEFQEYAVHGAYADWLRMEGQNGKALAEEQFARESLERQLERIYYTSGSPVVSSNFNTHSKSQSR